jgi:hypothetical protein
MRAPADSLHAAAHHLLRKIISQVYGLLHRLEFRPTRVAGQSPIATYVCHEREGRNGCSA